MAVAGEAAVSTSDRGCLLPHPPPRPRPTTASSRSDRDANSPPTPTLACGPPLLARAVRRGRALVTSKLVAARLGRVVGVAISALRVLRFGVWDGGGVSE
uniref:Uncharacterized protein n=1 Tax=Oryza punctata TaxID=4537 RepID=A0A0E0L3L4_ORYPU